MKNNIIIEASLFQKQRKVHNEQNRCKNPGW